MVPVANRGQELIDGLLTEGEIDALNRLLARVTEGARKLNDPPADG